MNQGKVVIGAMLVISIALAVFAWWTRYSRSQQVLSTWGRDAVVAIRTGEKVELLVLGPADVASSDPPELLVIPEWAPAGNGPERRTIRRRIDITGTPGLIHARHHLIHEKGFSWDAVRSEDCRPQWETALRFSKNGNLATMAFDFQCKRVCLVERQVEVGMAPSIAEALTIFFAELTEGPATPAAQTVPAAR